MYEEKRAKTQVPAYYIFSGNKNCKFEIGEQKRKSLAAYSLVRKISLFLP